jgi:hypothetical protein
MKTMLFIVEDNCLPLKRPKNLWNIVKTKHTGLPTQWSIKRIVDIFTENSGKKSFYYPKYIYIRAESQLKAKNALTFDKINYAN